MDTYEALLRELNTGTCFTRNSSRKHERHTKKEKSEWTAWTKKYGVPNSMRKGKQW